MGDKKTEFSILKLRGVLPAIALVLLGAVLVLASNVLSAQRADIATQNAQTQAQTVKESPLCTDEPQAEACVQSEVILNNPTTRELVAGPQGATGESGPRGVQGQSGPQGLQGPEGPMGPQGPKGDQGEQGFSGLAGLMGLNGEPGPMGPMGPVGPQGPEGAMGPEGPQGPQGPEGFSSIPTRISLDCQNGVVLMYFAGYDQPVVGDVVCPVTPLPSTEP